MAVILRIKVHNRGFRRIGLGCEKCLGWLTSFRVPREAECGEVKIP